MADDLFSGVHLGSALGGKSGGEGGLESALNTFVAGVKDLSLQRTLSDANNQVEAIRSSESKDQEKMNALRGVAQGLTLKMAGLGANAATINQVNDNLNPKPPTFQSPFEAYSYGIKTGDDTMTSAALKWHNEEMASKERMHKREMNTLGAQRFQEQQDQNKIKVLGNLSTKLDPMLQRNTPLGRLQLQLNKSQEGGTLTTDPTTTIRQIQELARLADSMYTGGVPTEGGTEHLRINNLDTRLATLQEQASTDPAAIKTPKFMQEYADIFNRVQSLTQAQISAGQKKAWGSQTAAAKKYGEDFADAAEKAVGERPKIVDGKVIFPSDLKEEDMGRKITKLIQEHGNDPDAPIVLEKLKEDPAFYGAVQRQPALNKLIRAYTFKRGGVK